MIPMRVFSITVLLVVLVEVILGLAFWAGWAWIGGWPGGVFLLAVVFLLLLLPWIGDLELDYNSRAGQTKIRLGWWGHLTAQTRPGGEVRGRFFLIPWRKKPDKKKLKPEKAEEEERLAREKARGIFRVGADNFEETVRLLLAGLQAGHELLWGARDLSVAVRAPTQIEPADRALAGVVGARKLGPVELDCTASGERQVQVHYQIGLLRAALIGLHLVLEGRPRAVVSSLRSAAKAEQNSKARTEPKEAE